MEKIYKEVEELLEFIKEELDNMNVKAEVAFMNGDCGNLYKIFVKKFPRFTTPFLVRFKEEPMHLMTKIGEKFYDITGETSLEKYIEYLKRENSDRAEMFESKEFELKQLSVADPIINKMCDMYRYNEDYEQSEINSEMFKLSELLEERDEEER